ncbi:hypothetical protein JDV02_004909 [Purpureocillium takamizusanense]|uniref:RING-type domain-containing protein n=1 Tax=Purpureocillium takamizusanense TaxID=2060973 RepID=A0A9Q8QDC6_9HYPO|nr:uncharacterized protein JDV02_004909 [Purpureocillium takamizusanense]UNI18654.1 hypothetical protein JDV02_004909 [Purpureocillium takamizusanense]
MDIIRDTPRYVVYRAKQVVRRHRLKRAALRLQQKTGPPQDGPWEPNPNSLRQHPVRSRIETPSTAASAEAAQERATGESADQKKTAIVTTGPVNNEKEASEGKTDDSDAENENTEKNHDHNAGGDAQTDRKGKGRAGPRAEPKVDEKKRQAAVPPPDVPVRPTITDTRQDSGATQQAPGPEPSEAIPGQKPETAGPSKPRGTEKSKVGDNVTSQVADHISCSICGEVYGETEKRGAEWPKEVYAYLHCRHVFGHECLFRWIADANAPPRCPKCGVSMRHACEHLTVPTHKPPRSNSLAKFAQSNAAIVPWDYEWCRTDEGRRLRSAVDRASWNMDRADSKKRDEAGVAANFGQSIVCKYRRLVLNRAVNKFNNKQAKWWARQWVDFPGRSAQFKEAKNHVKSVKGLSEMKRNVS